MESFADAVYRVHGDGGVIPLRIGQPSPAMAALMARHGARHGGLVTGENPFGQQQSDAENAAANEALRAAIDELGLVRVASDGGSEDGSWNEPGFLVLGGDDAVLDQLARRFRHRKAAVADVEVYRGVEVGIGEFLDHVGAAPRA